MKKYNVGFLTDDREMVDGIKPHNDIMDWDSVADYINAESEKEAIIFAIDYLCENIIESGYIPDVDYDNETITIYKNGNLIEQYYNFKAEIEEE